jgi:hypothetical protein
MLVELMRPAGIELSRRWLAALLLVPMDEREGVVASIESRIADVYAPASGIGPAAGKGLNVVHPPVQREGYVEQVTTNFELIEPAEPRASGKKRGAGGA